jgi:cytochrome c biogenesis protein CcdA
MIAFAFLAGILSILSPCVLPLVPIVLGAAVAEHRLGPVALGLGVALSFAAIGMFVQTIGFVVGIDADVFQRAAAVLLIIVGIVLMVPVLQMRFASAAGPVGAFAQDRFGGFDASGLPGQFGVGLLLGAVWSPCGGPTLGAAIGLAAESKNLWLAAAVMLAYGFGAGVPLMILGFLSREALMRWKSRLLVVGKATKPVMGALLVTLGVLMLSGFDKIVETYLVQASPAWLTDLTTRF